MKKKIVVAMSGGVDSSVTAALLAEQGHQVLGVFMENWQDEGVLRGCASWPKDRQDALRVARQLGIVFEVVNFERAYRRKVIDYFFREYAAGRTPNPDILCNRHIKFGLLLDWARQRGYEFLATGHYARIAHRRSGKVRLLRGVDRSKDQSYFLCQLTQRQLGATLFPLGNWRKADVRREAAKRGLPVADKPDSQGLCFVGEVDLGRFLTERISEKPGKVLTTAGEVVGEHHGAAFYTIGQRRGVGISKPVPMYVTATDIKKNTVTVGLDRELYTKHIASKPPHWIGGESSLPAKFDVGIRHRMEPARAIVKRYCGGLALRFNEPQRGPTPGQFAVLYRGEELVGSAVIK